MAHQNTADATERLSNTVLHDVHHLKSSSNSRTLPPLPYIIGAVVVSWLIYVNIARKYDVYKRRKDLRDRRRRAGIPDEDTRPFEIAYAAAAHKRRREEEERRKIAIEEARVAVEANTPFAQMASSFEQRIPYNVRMHALQPQLGLIASQTFPRAERYSETPAPIVQRRAEQSAYLRERYAPQVRQRDPYANGDSATITSSESPPEKAQPAPAAWEDRYAPATVKAANEKARAHQAAAATASTLGRRSRKDLDISADSDPETSRQRPRTKDWATGQEGEKDAEFLGRGRTRKRSEDAEVGDEHDNTRVKSRRRVDEPSMPGAMPAEPAQKAAGTGKRKADDQDAEVITITTTVEPTASAVRKSRKKAKRDGKGKTAESQTPKEPVKEPGMEWETDGVKYKMGDDGQTLREAVVKEKKTVVAPFREGSSPTRRAPNTKTTFHTYAKHWMTEEEYEKVKAEGRISDTFDQDVFMAEVQRQTSPMYGSETEEDIRSELGQTPLKSGALRTRLGHDRPLPMSPALIYTPKTTEAVRRQHMLSPARKMIFPTKRASTMTKTERVRAEEEAWANVRKGWAKAKQEKQKSLEPAIENKENAVVPTVSLFTPQQTSGMTAEKKDLAPSVSAPTGALGVPAFTVTPASTTPTPAATSEPAKTPFSFTQVPSAPTPAKEKAPENNSAAPAAPPLFTSFIPPTTTPATTTLIPAATSVPATTPAAPTAPAEAPKNSFNFGVPKPAETKAEPTAFSAPLATAAPNPPASNPFAALPPLSTPAAPAPASTTTANLFGAHMTAPPTAAAPAITPNIFGPPAATTAPNPNPPTAVSAGPFNSFAPTTAPPAPPSLFGNGGVSAPAFAPAALATTPATTAPKAFQFSSSVFGQPANTTPLTASAMPGVSTPFGQPPAGSQTSSGSQGSNATNGSNAAATGAMVTAPAGPVKFSFGSSGPFGSTNPGGQLGTNFGTPAAGSNSFSFAPPGGQQPAVSAATPTTVAPSSIFGAVNQATSSQSATSPFGVSAAGSTPAPLFGQNNTSALGITPTPFGTTTIATSGTPAAITPALPAPAPATAAFTFGAGFNPPNNPFSVGAQNLSAPGQASPFGQPPTPLSANPAMPGSATGALFNVGTPPPPARPLKGLPRSRR